MTLAEIDADLVVWTAARDAILVRGQSYTIDGRSLSRGDLETINAEIIRLRRLKDRAEAGGGVRIRYGTAQ